MALYRETPKCKHCGKPIAEGIYLNQDHLPLELKTIGDTFVRWEYTECQCKEAKKERQEVKSSVEQLKGFKR